ncbi:MAG: peptide ABC transporter substrate-binding protein, partial [Spirochaetes bacterium]
ELFTNSKHPYTRLLLESIPDADKRGKRLQTIPGKVPDAENIPGGCAFHTRCPISKGICKTDLPETKEVGSGKSGTSHTAACHFIGKQWKN